MNLQRIKAFLTEGVASGVYSAAACAISFDKGTQHHVEVGTTRADSNGQVVSEETLFDLASLTKVLLTTTVVARLFERNRFGLDSSILQSMPDLPWREEWREVTGLDLLSHRAGYVWWQDFFGQVPGAFQIPVVERRRRVLEIIAQMIPDYPRGSKTIYSDLGFIVLGEWIQRITGKSLEQLLEEEVQIPLGAVKLVSCPRDLGIPLQTIAATEDVARRGGLLHGEVHDDNAALLGGLAGHAGLFGTAGACLVVGKAWLMSWLGQASFLSKETARRFTTTVPSSAGTKGGRALGWDIPTGTLSSAGRNVSSKAVGHTGYTGTSLWIDLDRKVVVVLLTNRVHPTAKNEKIKSFRSAFHDLVWEEVGS